MACVATANGAKRAEALVRVQAPTAFDEVRCELQAARGAPKLRRPALRSSGKLTVNHVLKYVRMQLALDTNTIVKLSCAGEDLNETMTLNVLVRKVWPVSQGHLVLDYRIERDLQKFGV